MKKTFLIGLFLIVSVSGHYGGPHKIAVDKVQLTNIPKTFNFPKEISLSPEKSEKLLDNIEANVNAYADKVFRNIDKLMKQNGLDPATIPDIHENFNYTLIITYQGELVMTNGVLRDLSTIHRDGDTIIVYNPSTRVVQVTIPMSFYYMKFDYDYSAKIMGLGPAGKIEGSVAELALEVKLSFNTQTLQFSFDEFFITHSGKISLTFQGSPLIDWLLDALSFVATAGLKEVILLTVENIVRGGLQSAIDSINEAINGFLNPTTPKSVIDSLQYWFIQ